MRCGERQQRHMASPLDRRRQAALMPGTCAGAPPRQDLAAIRDIPLQSRDILVVGHADLIRAEGAHLAPRDELAPAGGARTGAAPPWATIVYHCILRLYLSVIRLTRSRLSREVWRAAALHEPWFPPDAGGFAARIGRKELSLGEASPLPNPHCVAPVSYRSYAVEGFGEAAPPPLV